MAVNGAVSWLSQTEKINGFEFSATDTDDEVHVLAVDDSHVDRKVIERLLKISSCKVTAVDSGSKALQFLGLDEEKTANGFVDSLKVDLIITDYCMPGMTGYELLKKVKESSVFREIPVVIMSSENVVTRIDRCLEEGAEDFIVKPVKFADVKRIIDYMGEEKEGEKGRIRGINKRKLRDGDVDGDVDGDGDGDDLFSSPPSIMLSSSSSTTSTSASSPSCPSSRTAPCSPSTLDSPTRRLRMTISE